MSNVFGCKYTRCTAILLHHLAIPFYALVAYLDLPSLQTQLSLIYQSIVVHSAHMSEEVQFPFNHSLMNIDCTKSTVLHLRTRQNNAYGLRLLLVCTQLQHCFLHCRLQTPQAHLLCKTYFFTIIFCCAT